MKRLNSTNAYRDGAKVVSVLSGKGGVGKSIIAFNLADRLSAVDKRVLLVDGDMAAGNLHILANARCAHGLRHVLSGQMQLSDAVTRISAGIDLLGASMQTSVEEAPGVGETANLIATIREQAIGYDFILIDHASGISDPAVVLAHASDMNCLVVVPELTSLADGYGLYKRLVESNRSVVSRLIVNRCMAEDESVYIREKFAGLAERFLGQSPVFAGSLPESQAVRKSVAQQRPVSQIAMKSTVVQQLDSLVRTLLASLSDSIQIRQDLSPKAHNEKEITADIGE